METAEIKAYHEIYRKELFDYVVPFWLSHSPDREYGGYLTLLERDGTVFDTDKYAWMQGREIWMFSKLCSVYGTRPEWVDAAGLGVAFMRAHGRAENGDFYFAMDRKGNALIHPYNIFSDCFMCTALAEYSRVTGDEQAHTEALEIYRRIQQRKDHPKGIWTKAVAGARNLCAMAMPMIQMMMARELRGFVPDAELNPIVEENLDLFFRRHVDRERKCVFERVLPDGGHLFDVMEGRPVFGLKGGKWKGFFHLPRMLMVCERWLNEMAEQ